MKVMEREMGIWGCRPRGRRKSSARRGWNVSRLWPQHATLAVSRRLPPIQPLCPVQAQAVLSVRRRRRELTPPPDRRDINRRSAQKHRLRRKQEVEDLTRLLAERDARIAALEREVEVERARVKELRGFVRAQAERAEGQEQGEQGLGPDGARGMRSGRRGVS